MIFIRDMTRKAIISSPLLIFLGLLIGIFASLAPSTSVILLIALASIIMITKQFDAEEEKRFIVLLFLVGLLSRIILCSLLHLYASSHNIGYFYDDLDLFAPDMLADSGANSIRGWLTAEYMHGKITNPDWLDQSWLFSSATKVSYSYLPYTVMYYYFGFCQLSVKFINCLMGTLSAVLIYCISKEIFNSTIAKIASLLTMFFPSLFLWSLSNLKEPQSLLLICIAIFTVLKVVKYRKIVYLPIIFMAIYIIKITRPPLHIPMLAGTLIAIISHLNNRSIKNLIIITSLVIFLLLLSGVSVLGVRPCDVNKQFQNIVSMQKGYVSTGGSVYKIYDDSFYTDRVGDINMKPLSLPGYLLKGWAYFLFSPFPWDINTKLKLIALPQIILWYVLAFCAVVAIFCFNILKMKDALTVLSYIFFITSSFALTSGNIGTALRHRDVVLPLVFVFSAAGLTKLIGRGNRTG